MVDPDPEELPTDFLLRQTRSRVPWRIILVLCAAAAAAGGVFWYLMGHG